MFECNDRPKGFGFPKIIISYAVYLYYRFLLAYRDVQELTSSAMLGSVMRRCESGAASTWRMLRELSLTNLDVISDIAVTKQLALGLPTAVDISFSIVKEKTEHQQLVHEAFLKMASNSILYQPFCDLRAVLWKVT